MATLPSPPPTPARHVATPAGIPHPLVNTKDANPTPRPKVSLPRTWPPPPAIQSSTTVKQHLSEFNKKYLGLAHYDTTSATLGETFYCTLVSTRDDILHTVPWTASLPSKVSLLTAFGRQDTLHSFTQEALFKTILFHLLRSGYLSVTDTVYLLDTHPLVFHLSTSYISLRRYDFRFLQQYDPEWASQAVIPCAKQSAMLACLFHYDLNTSLLVRYLGNNYTGAYRNVPCILSVLRSHNIDPHLIDQYTRVMITGCPNRFVAETSRENALLHWR
jgi:hypothetical protein